MIRIFLICFFAGLTIHSNAQFDSASENDPEATVLLQDIKERFNQSKQFAATFEMKIHFPGQEDIIEKGELIQEGDQFYLDMDSYLIVSNNKKKWVYLKKDNTVSIYNATTEDGWLTPKDFLQMYEDEAFVYAMVPQEMDGNKDAHFIEFKSAKGDSEYSKMRMSISKKDTTIKSVKAFAKDGSRYELTIREIDFEPNVTQNLFVFDTSRYPQIKIEDLRID